MASPHVPTDPPRPALAALAVGMRRLREQAGLSQRIVGRVLAVRAQMASLQSAVAVQALDQRILATLLPSSGP
jgi:hypothetical protein